MKLTDEQEERIKHHVGVACEERDSLGTDVGELVEDAILAALSDPRLVPQDDEITVRPNSQQWKGMRGEVAFHLIQRHADGWADARLMMDEWHQANMSQPGEPEF